MRMPIGMHEAAPAIKAGAETIIVIHGPREWAWMQMNTWRRLKSFAVVMCPPDVDPISIDWRFVRDRCVLVLGWASAFDNPTRLTRALLDAGPDQLHVDDLSNPWAVPAHFEREGDEWVRWTGLGPRGEMSRDRTGLRIKGMGVSGTS